MLIKMNQPALVYFNYAQNTIPTEQLEVRLMLGAGIIS